MPSVSSSQPGIIADELSELDRKIGWLIVNRFTYRLLRLLDRLSRPDFDSSDVTIETDKAEKTIRVIPKVRSGTGALLLIHGGGFVIGQPSNMLAKAAHFARDLGIPVICPAYRLSPQERAPAALDDCHRAWTDLVSTSDAMGIDPAKIVVAGYSAGGGLAANLVHRLHDEGGVQPAAQLLIYPMLDDSTANRGELDTPRHRVWSNRNNRFGWTSFLGHTPGKPSKQYAVAARREDLSGLPPAWIGVGTCDLFLDEGRAFAERLRAANVDTTYVEVDGGIHGFDMSGTPLGRAFTALQVAFLRRFAV